MAIGMNKGHGVGRAKAGIGVPKANPYAGKTAGANNPGNPRRTGTGSIPGATKAFPTGPGRGGQTKNASGVPSAAARAKGRAAFAKYKGPRSQ